MLAVILALLALATPPRQHIKTSTTASPSRAAAGSTITLFVDVTPDPGIHVYAPGAKDYQPIAIALDAQQALAVKRIVFPQSERMIFDGEPVPVFQKPFRVQIAVAIAPRVAAGTKLTATGRVDYQACDDKVCFIPASLPVSWTVEVTPRK